MNIKWLCISICFAVLIPALGTASTQVQVGRFTSVSGRPTPAEINPLNAIGSFHFPASVQTVGGAVDLILADTGFSLANQAHLSSDVKKTLNMPLPITCRDLGPVAVHDALTVLMGQSVYQLRVNLICQHFSGQKIKKDFGLSRILRVINNH